MTLYVEYPSPRGISGLEGFVNMDLVQVFGVSRPGGSDTFEIFVELTSSEPEDYGTGKAKRISIARADDNPTMYALKRQLMDLIKGASGTVLFIRFDGKQFVEIK